MRIKRSALLFCSFVFAWLASNNLQAQDSFLEGYYITMEDDTVRGLIDRRPPASNFAFFIFKSRVMVGETKHFPVEVKGYVIMNTLFYESHTLPGDQGELVAGFYQLLIKGKLSLLQYEKRYFGKTISNEVFLLSTRKVKIVPPRDVPGVRDFNSVHGDFYKTDYSGLGWLKAQMQDCPEVAQGLENAYRSEKIDFLSIFDKYNQCVGSPIFKPGKLKKSPVRGGIADLKKNDKE